MPSFARFVLAVSIVLGVAGCPGPEVVPPGEDAGPFDAPGTDVPRPDAPLGDVTPADAPPGVDAPGACTDPDVDGDGADSMACGGLDCDDADPTRAPGLPEVCDAADLDEDCDASTFGTRDVDTDGHVDAACCNGTLCGDDCNDMVTSISPLAPEVCDSVDQDCDSAIDEGVMQVAYVDADLDMFGDSASATTVGCTLPMGFSLTGGDCDDSRMDRNPGTTEICDGVDNDCDTMIDEVGGVTYYRDADGDGQGDATMPNGPRCSAPAGHVVDSSDCDDTNRNVGQGFAELCDGLDNDCDGLRDEGGTNTFWQDADEDGYGDASRSIVVSSCVPPPFHVANPSDCNDDDATSHPMGTEVCDGRDNDCSGGRAGRGIDTREDADADMHAPIGATCTGGPFPADDCNDGNAAVRPGAPEICDRLDNDCSAGGGTEASEDVDADGYAAPTASCVGGPLPRTDCDDTRPLIHPGAIESCDGLDVDCVPSVEDADGDMHAPSGAACTGGFPRDDCNDSAAGTYPGASESCDRLDNDCSAGGGVDAGEDGDNDGYAPVTATCSGGPLPRTDCNDSAATINPGATEVCDRLDQNCSSGGGIDTSEDVDGDSHTAIGVACAGGFPRDDCNDTNLSVFPGAAEACDGVDGDCSSGGGVELTEDADGDRHAATAAACSGGAFPRDDCNDALSTTYGGAPELCNRLDDDCSSGGGVLTSEDADSDTHAPTAAACTGGPLARDDCNDASAAMYPGAPELCNRLDDDCSSGGGVLAAEDVDADMHAPPTAACSGGPFPRDDCNDANATLYPGATELCDRLDNDCSSGGGVVAAEDADNDMFAAVTAACTGGPFPRTDCNDASAAVYPGTFTAPVGPHAAATASSRPTLYWAAPASGGCGAPTYEVHIDDSCTTPGFAGCALASPEAMATGVASTSYRPATGLPVASTAPVGRRYYWRVRGCEGTSCGAWSAVRYVDVGRPPSDFDGDGYSDVVVGAPEADAGAANEGNVFVFRGGAAGVPASPTVTLDNPGNVVNGAFGTSVAWAGDLNADGYGDLVVGAPEQAAATIGGRAFVYHGSALGLSAMPTTTLEDTEPNAWFGYSVASAGDLNGDGYADLVVGVPHEDVPAASLMDVGIALVYSGSATGVTTAATTRLENPFVQANQWFGSSVASAGDVNGDGYADLVVGARYQYGTNPAEGRAFVYLGAAAGVPNLSLPTTTLNGGTQPAGNFGYSVASAGDVNGDGYADLVVGAPQQFSGAGSAGRAFVFQGGAAGLPTMPTITLGNPTGQASGGFGFSVSSAGDVNGDGYADLVIGANGQSATASGEGNAFVYAGSAAGVAAAPSIALDNPANQAGGGFGSSVASAGDVNRDGYADLVIGAALQDAPASDEGNVFVFHGQSTGAPPLPTTTLDSPANQAGDTFGYSVAWADPGDSRRSRGRGPPHTHASLLTHVGVLPFRRRV